MGRHSYRSDPNVPHFDDHHPVIVYDGVCNLCNSWVNFLLRHDRRAQFRFVAAQSPLGEALFAHYDLKTDGDYDTVMLIDDGRLFVESASWLATMSWLGWPWKLAGVVRIVPAVLRDPVYRWIARNRYRWFGRQDVCRLPTPETRARFL